MRLLVFIAISLDGFIARADGSLDWLPGSDGTPSNEDTGYEAFYASVDTMVMGRNTYELVQSFGAWPHAGKRVVVLSSNYAEVMQEIAVGVYGISASPAIVVNELKKLGAKHVYVDGGKAIQGFLRAGLINEITLTRIPVLLGEGIPLFGRLEHDIGLRHCSTRTFNNGMVQSKYEVIR